MPESVPTYPIVVADEPDFVVARRIAGVTRYLREDPVYKRTWTVNRRSARRFRFWEEAETARADADAKGYWAETEKTEVEL